LTFFIAVILRLLVEKTSYGLFFDSASIILFLFSSVLASFFLMFNKNILIIEKFDALIVLIGGLIYPLVFIGFIVFVKYFF